MPIALNNGPTGSYPTTGPGDADDVGRKPAAHAKLVESLAPSTTHLGELRNLASAPPAPGVSNSNGAPEIDGVKLDMSPEDMAAALLLLQNKTQQAQLRTATEGIQINKTKLDQKNQEALAKIQEVNKSVQGSQGKEKASGIVGWIGKVFAMIGAVFGVVLAAMANAASGGAAAPLLALAICGVVGATVSLASQISQAAGGPALDLSVVVPKLFTIILEAAGVPKEKAESVAKVMSGALAVALPLALATDPELLSGALGGIAELAGGSADQISIVTSVFTVLTALAAMAAMMGTGVASGRMMSELPAVMKSASQITQAGLGVLNGAVGVTHGGLGLVLAADRRTVDDLQADKKAIDAQITRLMAKMSDDQEDVKKALTMIMDSYTAVSQMIQAAGENHAHIASNLARRGTV